MDTLIENIQISLDGSDLEGKLKSLPQLPGIYKFINDQGKVIYVGKAISLKSRVRSYFHQNNPNNLKLNALVSKIKNLEIIVTNNEVEALILESNLIKSLKPRYNVLLKDDKSFPFIVITNEPYPQVFPTRRVKQDGSKYFGPYTEAKVMKSAFRVIRDILMVRNCKYYLDEEVIRKKKVKLCLEYQIKKCGGPCEGLISYTEYQQIILNVEKLLNGKISGLMGHLLQRMSKASEEMKYEEAKLVKHKIDLINMYSSRQKLVSLNIIDRDIFAFVHEDQDACAVILKVRDGRMIDKRHYYVSNINNLNEEDILENVVRSYYLESNFIPDEIFLQKEIDNIEILKTWLSERKKGNLIIKVPTESEDEKLISMCQINARYLLDELKIQKMKKDNYIPFSVKALQKDLRLTKLPRKIECFDISNIQGSDSVASMVSFFDGKPRKSEYRKFNIRSVNGANDFQSIEEVVFRRYKRILEEKSSLPDLIIIDGGKGQLSSAKKALAELNLNDIQVIGLAKKHEEIFFPNLSDAQMLAKTSSSLRLLQNIRDEAHRFAITFHRDKRDHRILQTELEKIRSVGSIKAKILLTELGSVESVKVASIESLSKLVGNRSAESITEYFRKGSQ